VNVFGIASVGSVGAGILASLLVARGAGLATSRSVALASAGALIGLGIYALAVYLGLKLSALGQKTGKQAAITSLGITGVIIVAASPFATWFCCVALLRLFVPALGG
jgi:hypothetical protein